MDGPTLFRQGVLAIREQNDPARGRALLLAALEQDPNQDLAWLWLTRTVADNATRLQYIERALAINPANELAQKLKASLQSAVGPAAAAPASAPATVEQPPTPDEQARIAELMARADTHAEAGEIEEAIGQWVEVLKIRVDHERALRNATGHLWKLGYRADARELVANALAAGTRVPSVIMTAIDMAERERDSDQAEHLRQQLTAQPGVDEQLLLKVADYDVSHFHPERAEAFLQAALETNPRYQQVLVRLGDMLTEQNRNGEALVYYDRAVRAGGRSQAAREADKRLAGSVPVLTDRERGSWLLAARETLGISLIFLLLAVQDAGLSLVALGPRRWAGVALSLLGGYLVVTATSSPQQRPLAAWLGGRVPEAPAGDTSGIAPRNKPGQAAQEPTALPILPVWMRYTLGALGAVILLLAFVMVFHLALDLVRENPPPYLLWSD